MAAPLRGHSLPGSLGKASERLGIPDGDVGQNLAVELDAGLAQAVHELAVAHALAPGGGAYAGDPQPAEVALAVAAVAGGGGGGLEEGLLGPLLCRGSLAAGGLCSGPGGPARLSGG